MRIDRDVANRVVGAAVDVYDVAGAKVVAGQERVQVGHRRVGRFAVPSVVTGGVGENVAGQAAVVDVEIVSGRSNQQRSIGDVRHAGLHSHQDCIRLPVRRYVPGEGAAAVTIQRHVVRDPIPGLAVVERNVDVAHDVRGAVGIHSRDLDAGQHGRTIRFVAQVDRQPRPAADRHREAAGERLERASRGDGQIEVVEPRDSLQHDVEHTLVTSTL